MKVSEIKLPVTASYEEVYRACLKKSGISAKNAEYFRLLKKSLDARDKNDIKYVYSAEISERPFPNEKVRIAESDGKSKVAVVGFGPCGMFLALYLARAGYKPLVLERGKRIDERIKTVNRFAEYGILDEDTNAQFGEGGAGAFSDGKLNTGVSDPLIRTVLKDLVSFGAPEEISYLAKPHIGSDNLPRVVENLRKEIEKYGGEVRFGAKVTDFNVKNGKIVSLRAGGEDIPVDAAAVAVGHSARDVFALLMDKGAEMERKQFAMGVRIEHLARDINLAQYGEKFANLLPAADYSLSYRKGERGVFTFCMCPGGVVMPSSSEEGGVVTNGMSLYARDGVNSNCAVLCEVYPSDFLGGVLGGAELQKRLERAAFTAGGGDYRAPFQTFGNFLEGKTGEYGKVVPSYSIGVKETDFNAIAPKYIAENLKAGIIAMGEKLKGFSDKEAVLTGFETRSSSPVRIIRNERGTSPSFINLYPCGEGCGYAGGIMSAAVDGIKTAVKIAENLSECMKNR